MDTCVKNEFVGNVLLNHEAMDNHHYFMKLLCFQFFHQYIKKPMSFYLCGKERKVGEGNELLQNSSCVLEIA